MEWPKITINTPLSEVQSIHKRIWDYVIEHGKKPETPYVRDCVLCEYDTIIRECLEKSYGHICECCPCKDLNPEKGCLNDLYYKYDASPIFSQEKIIYARQIRDIPFKEEGYWKQYSQQIHFL